MLAWLEIPDEGRSVLNGTALDTLSSGALIGKRSEFQLLLQDPYNALPPRTTVGRMIEESLRIRGGVPDKTLRSRVLAAMAEVGLPAAVSRRVICSTRRLRCKWREGVGWADLTRPDALVGTVWVWTVCFCVGGTSAAHAALSREADPQIRTHENA